jgi:hypothetical protein
MKSRFDGEDVILLERMPLTKKITSICTRVAMADVFEIDRET